MFSNNNNKGRQPVRTTLSSEFHQDIMEFIGAYQKSIDSSFNHILIVEKLNEIKLRKKSLALVESGKNDYSILHDAVHLPYEILFTKHRLAKSIADQCALKLFSTLIDKINHQTITRLFKRIDESAFNLIHDIVISSDEIFRLYLRKVDELLENGFMEENDFINILFTPSDNGYTPFLKLINEENPAILRTMLDLFVWLHGREKINLEDYRDQVINTGHSGFNALQIILRNRSSESFLTYANSIFSIGEKPNCESLLEAFAASFFEKNDGNYSSLHSAFLNKDPDMAVNFVKVLRRLGVYANDMVSLLLSKNLMGYTGLHCAANSGSPKNVELFFELLKDYKDHIMPEALEELFLANAKGGYNFIHQLAMNNPLGSLEYSIRMMEELLGKQKSQGILKELVFQRTEKGYLPISNKYDEINIYLNSLRNQYEALIQSPRLFQQSHLSKNVEESKKEIQHETKQQKHSRPPGL